MMVRIVGGHGGVSPGFRATSYLVDGKLLIDAGAVASGMTIDEQVLIDNILISHSHLDHICELAFGVGWYGCIKSIKSRLFFIGNFCNCDNYWWLFGFVIWS